MAKRTRRKPRGSPDRQIPDEPRAPAEGLEGSVEPMKADEPHAEAADGAQEPEAPEQPGKACSERGRRSRGGIRCPVCGRSGEPTGDAGRVRCGTCGTVFRRERPALGEVAKARDARFSRAFALPNSEERREARALAGEVMRGFFLIRKGKPAALNAFGRHVLEVNCGLGFRLRAFQNYGWAAAGTETSATAYEYARRQSLEVTHGWLAEGRFGRTRFDLALFCASLGEMDDPHKTVTQIRDLMAPEGLVCVLREPLADEGAEPTLDESRLFLYTAGSLERVFTGNGFTPVSGGAAEGAGTFWFKVKTRRGK